MIDSYASCFAELKDLKNRLVKLYPELKKEETRLDI